jgi:hypothetical protein
MGGPPDFRLRHFELRAGDESAGFATERPAGDPPTREHSA